MRYLFLLFLLALGVPATAQDESIPSDASATGTTREAAATPGWLRG